MFPDKVTLRIGRPAGNEIITKPDYEKRNIIYTFFSIIYDIIYSHAKV